MGLPGQGRQVRAAISFTPGNTLAQVDVPPGTATWEPQLFPLALSRTLSTKKEVRNCPDRVWTPKVRTCLPHPVTHRSLSPHQTMRICPNWGWRWDHKGRYNENKGFEGVYRLSLYMLFSLYALILWERGFLKSRKFTLILNSLIHPLV